MSLDDEHVTTREMVRRQREADWAIAEAEWRERCLTESEEAEAASWDRKMRQLPDHIARQVWT